MLALSQTARSAIRKAFSLPADAKASAFAGGPLNYPPGMWLLYPSLVVDSNNLNVIILTHNDGCFWEIGKEN